MTQAATTSIDTGNADILAVAREQVLGRGEGLDSEQVLAVLRLGEDRLDELLELAHEVRMRWCGPEVEVEGIISLKTGGCTEDCNFCSQSAVFDDSPVRGVWLDKAELVEAAKATAATGATEFCIVAAVRGADDKLLKQVDEGIQAIRAEGIDIPIAASLGLLTARTAKKLKEIGVHKYNHNLETARSYFPSVVTTHEWDERLATLELVRDNDMELCSGGIIGMGESLEQRAEFASQIAALNPDDVPINFLNPQPGTPFENMEPVSAFEALSVVAAFRLALPRTTLRFAGGREITLGDLGAKRSLLGGANAMIVGNYLTTLGRSIDDDLEMLEELKMPIKALSASL